MSLRALNWGMRLPIKPANSKFVLIVLCDFAGDTGKTFPSMETIVSTTGMMKETVLKALADLLQQKVIADTGQRTGELKQTIVWQICKDTTIEAKVKATRKQKPLATEALVTADKIYQIYPRKVGRPKALQKIVKAITNYGFETVLNGTKAFVDAWKNSGRTDITFCPHPATFFEQERFNDDPRNFGLVGVNKAAPHAPRMKDVVDYAKEKESDSSKATHWAISFFSAMQKRKWLINEKPFEWKEVFSKQIMQWRQKESPPAETAQPAQPASETQQTTEPKGT